MVIRRHAVLTAVVAMTIAAWYAGVKGILLAESIVDELDRAKVLANLAPRPQATIVYDRYDRPAFTFFVEQRIAVPLDRVSRHMIDALLAVEDRRFFSHHGMDPIRIAGAAWRNFRAGRIVEGGSTITQQLARASLSSERTYDRKIREILLAAQIEQRYTKAQILEQYLNTVYLGDGYYGVEAASQGYFGKSALDLEPHEAALLAALVRSPSSDAPSLAPARALKRRNLVLRLMRRQGLLSEQAWQNASALPLPPGRHSSAAVVATNGLDSGFYFQEEIRRQLFSLFGADKVLRDGLRVYSTYDPELQRQAEMAVTRRIAEISKSRPSARDLQGSLVAMDPTTGDVRALVGGRDFKTSSFNRATQARRQAGSSFKPIIYAAALERGYSPGTLLHDLDIPIDAGNQTWLPAGEHEDSEYTLRAALKVSSNRAAAQLLKQIGVSVAVYYAQRLGIESQLPMVPSLALGTGEVTLLELTTAYTAFANQGRVAAPRLIARVDDGAGVTIYSAGERHTQAISPTTAYLMSSMLSDVISGGTGWAARATGFKLPAAGKTGTTDNYADAWFVGYTPHLVAGVWFGLDQPAPIMRGGFAGVVAAPAWGRFMKAATTHDKGDWYPMPSDVEKVAICRFSGARATEACRHPQDMYTVARADGSPQLVPVDAMRDQDDGRSKMAVNEPPVYEDLFAIGTVPPDLCPIHNTTTSPTIASSSVSGTTQIANSVMPTSSQFAASPPSLAPRPSDIVLERVLGSDGLMHVVMRQRR
ncbi:MAG TPA: PBP1A family penicillin-binding protein [Vicinamibacterales bacterium]|jgi:1A family penicillin-binding protein|nr:PBP1A family penicillin-binding protein [Vicinamibacterales bacterium]